MLTNPSFIESPAAHNLTGLFFVLLYPFTGKHFSLFDFRGCCLLCYSFACYSVRAFATKCTLIANQYKWPNDTGTQHHIIITVHCCIGTMQVSWAWSLSWLYRHTCIVSWSLGAVAYIFCVVCNSWIQQFFATKKSSTFIVLLFNIMLVVICD